MHRQSQFEAMCALDLVALMISSIRPGHAETSMSRHLKDNIPSGSLGTERIRRKEESPAFKRMADLATRGWRVDALRASASSLLAATSRLSEEAEREATYWNEVLEVKARGWAVCRAPRDIQNLSVRFGFSEGKFNPPSTRKCQVPSTPLSCLTELTEQRTDVDLNSGC